jgi:hypothetical protein
VSQVGLSPDGAWRWDGRQWVPNNDNRPASPPPWADSEGAGKADLGATGVLAFVLTGVAIATILVQVSFEVYHAFHQYFYVGSQWYVSFWYELFALIVSVAALILGVRTASRTKRLLGVLIAVTAGGAFLQTALIIFYRVVVNHYAYGGSII